MELGFQPPRSPNCKVNTLLEAVRNGLRQGVPCVCNNGPYARSPCVCQAVRVVDKTDGSLRRSTPDAWESGVAFGDIVQTHLTHSPVGLPFTIAPIWWDESK